MLEPSGPTARPEIRVEIRISATNLTQKNTYCILSLFDNADSKWSKIGKSEVIKENYSPHYLRDFVTLYSFEEYQMMKVKFYDADSDAKTDLTLGVTEFTLGQLIAAPGLTLHLPLMCPEENLRTRSTLSNYSVVTISADEYTPLQRTRSQPKDDPQPLDKLVLEFKGSKLDKKDFFGKSDPL
jgi:hypothetical protein